MTDSSTSHTAYRVLARKYRPKNFDDLIGQEAMVRTLTNAFSTGRVAQAYMLTGLRGIGKTTTARLIARALNYPTGASVEMPELTAQCEAILESRHIDVIEMDAASNTGVDNMREIIGQVQYAPVQLRTKVYIIDEVHMLSKSAFNALLKTLEEPPPHVKFIFATTEIRKVPVTILSRCQRFDLRRLDVATLQKHYAKICTLENVVAEGEGLRLIAKAAEGSVRDGLSLLDQAIAFGDGSVKTADVMGMLGLMEKGQVITLFEAVMAGDVARALEEVDRQYQAGGDPETILTDLADFTHFVTRLKVAPQSAGQDASRTEEEIQKGQDFAKRLSMAHLSRCWQMLLKGVSETAQAAQPIKAAEMLVIRLAHAANLPSGEELIKHVQEQKLTMPRTSPQISAPPRETVSEARVISQAKPAHAENGQAQAPQARIKNFADIVTLAAEKRDIKFKTELERFIRPISVADGKIEIALEAGCDPTLANEMSRKLEAWTGRRWIIAVSKAGGEATVTQQRKDAKDTAFKWAKAQVEVQAVLKAFPGAEILNVSEVEPISNLEESDDEPR